MSDLNAMELQATTLSAALPTRTLVHARNFAVGAVVALAVAAFGGALVTVTLTALLVGAPLVAIAIGWTLYRESRRAPARVGAGG